MTREWLGHYDCHASVSTMAELSSSEYIDSRSLRCRMISMCGNAFICAMKFSKRRIMGGFLSSAGQGCRAFLVCVRISREERCLVSECTAKQWAGSLWRSGQDLSCKAKAESCSVCLTALEDNQMVPD